MTTNNIKLAVLIDADNAPADSIDAILEEIAKYGVASVKRIYGDWSHGLSKWKATLLPHAIIPVQQFAYTKGKNATDMALVIDAMDLLYSGNVNGFCIISSDSDFTRLASRIRESGLTVYGFGEKKTPESFRRACDKFVYIELFRAEDKNTASKSKNKPTQSNNNETPKNQELLKLIKRAVKENADDLGWANLGPIGSYLNKINPDFDSRLYGFGKLSDLIKSLDAFEHRTDNNQLQVRRLPKVAENNKENNPLNHLNHQNNTQNEEKAVSGSLKKGKTKNTPKLNQPNQQNEGNQEIKELANQNNGLHNEEKSVSSSLKKGKTKNAPKLNQPNQQNEVNQEIKELANQNNGLHNEEKAVSGSLKKAKPSFSKIIPLVQAVVLRLANADGWAKFSSVVKMLEAEHSAPKLGFDDFADLVHAIYGDWLEINKIGRGERIRVKKQFVAKESATLPEK